MLSDPSNAAIVQSTATVTIGASGGTTQSSPYIYAPSNTVIGEADGWVDLPVTLGAPSSNQVTVDWTVATGECNQSYPLSVTGANGTTQADGASGAGTLTFVPGQVLQAIRMQVNGCTMTDDLTATFTLSDAVNGIIEAATCLITVTPPPAAPGAPTIGSATAGNYSATVTFTPPTSDGGSPITSYTVTSNPGGITASGSASPIAVTGLTPGNSYTFTVTATNAVGTSSTSAVSNMLSRLTGWPSAHRAFQRRTR